MAQPIWITTAGSLGTIAEGKFFQLPLLASESSGDDVYYEMIAGQLPSGMQCSKTGLIEGTPYAIASLQGVPTEVSQDVTSKFAIRAYTERPGPGGVDIINRLADRTFTITVSGQDSPKFTTPTGLIAQAFDGRPITAFQIEYTDTDPEDNVTVTVASGQLPPGLTISNQGLISGYIIPLSPPGETAGFDRESQGYDKFPFDFSTRSTSVTYEFVLEVSDGNGSDLRAFSIFVIGRGNLLAGITDITADNTFVTADGSPARTPFILTTPGSLGRVRTDNWFAFKFDGIDFDGDPFEFSITVGDGIGFDATGTTFDATGVGFDRGAFELPPGLTLDPTTGYLYGYIPSQGLTEQTYNFAIRVHKANDVTIISDFYYFDITLIGDIDSQVTWITDSDFGNIDNGATSIFYVAATNALEYVLQYRLKTGSNSKLPQGLELLPSGNIVGRVSFDTFALDLGTTTFDVTANDLAITGTDTETTFDSKFTFTVNAFSSNGFVSVFKDFSITVKRTYHQPYQNLYVKAMPPENDRDLLNLLLQNQDIFQPEFLYRSDDPNFGLATNVIYHHAFGLKASTLAEYVNSLGANHYWKTLTLGPLKTAQALDSTGAVIYEVVYSSIIDNLVNNSGASVSSSITLPYPINDEDSTEISFVYPNSLINMRDQVIDEIGQISTTLPLWMMTKQSNGKVLGFVPAWVLAYTKPGKAKQVLYYIQEQFVDQLNRIDFRVDRYVLDRLLSINWDPIDDSTRGSWNPTANETTFDVAALPPGIRSRGSVSYATELPFEQIDNRTLASIVALGGFDGVTDVNSINNTLLIFKKQEDFTSPLTDEEAFTDYLETYDLVPYDKAGSFYDKSVLLPENQRLSIYLITVSAGIVTLTLDKTTEILDYVLVTQGNTWAKTQLYLPTAPTPGLLRRTWSLIPEKVLQETTFDGGSLAFIVPVDMYTCSDVHDKYIMFPKQNILG